MHLTWRRPSLTSLRSITWLHFIKMYFSSHCNVDPSNHFPSFLFQKFTTTWLHTSSTTLQASISSQSITSLLVTWLSIHHCFQNHFTTQGVYSHTTSIRLRFDMHTDTILTSPGVVPSTHRLSNPDEEQQRFRFTRPRQLHYEPYTFTHLPTFQCTIHCGINPPRRRVHSGDLHAILLFPCQRRAM